MSAPTIEKLTGEEAETKHGFWKLLILGQIEFQNLLERDLGAGSLGFVRLAILPAVGSEVREQLDIRQDLANGQVSRLRKKLGDLQMAESKIFEFGVIADLLCVGADPCEGALSIPRVYVRGALWHDRPHGLLCSHQRKLRSVRMARIGRTLRTHF